MYYPNKSKLYLGPRKKSIKIAAKSNKKKVNKQIQVDFVLVETWDLRSPNPGRVTIRSQSTDPIRAEKANNWNWKSLILTWNVDDWYPDVRLFISFLNYLKIWTVWETRYLSIHFKVSSFCFFCFLRSVLIRLGHSKDVQIFFIIKHFSCSYSIIVTYT